jgi:hypothetical protein
MAAESALMTSHALSTSASCSSLKLVFVKVWNTGIRVYSDNLAEPLMFIYIYIGSSYRLSRVTED